MKENIYIQILKFGRDKLESELNHVQLMTKIKKISGKDGYFALEVIRTFFVLEKSGKVYLKGDALFNLIQYERIEETRKESKRTLLIAIAAIGLNILGILATIFIHFKII